MTVEELRAHAEDQQPDVIIADQIDKFKNSGIWNNETQRRNDLYVQSREIAKRNNCLMFNICQASADAHDHRQITYDMADMSKTGKAAEADFFLGIGADPGVEESFMRYLTISKNKIDGIKGTFDCFFNPAENKWDSPE